MFLALRGRFPQAEQFVIRCSYSVVIKDTLCGLFKSFLRVFWFKPDGENIFETGKIFLKQGLKDLFACVRKCVCEVCVHRSCSTVRHAYLVECSAVVLSRFFVCIGFVVHWMVTFVSILTQNQRNTNRNLFWVSSELCRVLCCHTFNFSYHRPVDRATQPLSHKLWTCLDLEVSRLGSEQPITNLRGNTLRMKWQWSAGGRLSARVACDLLALRQIQVVFCRRVRDMQHDPVSNQQKTTDVQGCWSETF